jgi:hypothetical protein
MKFKIVFISFFISISVNAQIGTGEWRFHSTTKAAIDVVATEEHIYTAFENGLSVLKVSDKSQVLLNVLNGLSDIEISCLFYDYQDKSLYIGYENGNIDRLKNDVIYNIPALELASVSSSKRINRFVKQGDFIYAACDFAILKIDPLKNEIKDTYYPTNSLEAVNDICFKGDTVYALSPTKLLKGILSNPALADPSQWSIDPRVLPQIGVTYKELENFNNNLVVLMQVQGSVADSVIKLNPNGHQVISSFPWEAKINSINVLGNGKLAINANGAYVEYDQDYNQVLFYGSGTFNKEFLVSRSSSNSVGTWISDLSLGLVWFPSDYFSYDLFTGSGSLNKYFYSMDCHNGKLAIASGYLVGKLPGFSRNGIHFFENESWKLTDVFEQSCWDGLDVFDFIDVSINPKNPNEYASCTYSEVPLTVFNNNQGEVFTEDNSTLKSTSVGNGWSLVSDVSYDDKGNLWCLNGYCDRPLNVRSAEDSSWMNFDLGFAAKNKYTKKMIIDFDGNIWCATDNAGLFGYSTNGTLSNTTDDKRINLKSGENYGALPSENITAIAADFEGEIWIGTDAGFAILYSANSSFDANPGEYDAQRVKVQFEGNVEYVLGSTHITDIEVDGGNRKWIATANAGILLLSADGSEIIEQHTTENSPLISDIIYDLKLDQTTGELFIITDKGLVSYRTNATYEDPEYQSTTVFPNPVRPSHLGPVTIQGIRYNSDVKITDLAGNLVFKTTSNGGTATWDCKNLNGERVASGVYLIWTAMNEGKDKKVGKVLVMN